MTDLDSTPSGDAPYIASGDAPDDSRPAPSAPEAHPDEASGDAPALLFEPVPEGHKSGYAALVGAPNVGKSTLLNRVLGTKLSIVTPRPSTTRNRVLGILSSDGSDGNAPHQVVFLDTPGVVRPKYRLHDYMMRDVDRALRDADVAVFLADATQGHISHDAEAALQKLDGFSGHSILALNKVDLLPMRDDALPLVDLYRQRHDFEEVVPISALNGKGTDNLLSLILARIPEGPPYYPADQISEHPERFFVSEIVREAVFNLFRDEVPYSTSVVVVQFDEREREKDYIACDIVVERDSQKGILIGKGGQALKRLGQAARREIEDFLGRPVYLQLHVKTRSDWRNREGHLREYGYG
ncbi:GTPase Era [Rubricoccus marinus]|uniref:GTPase Era n=1 Tax=Rubricoccus marinus TaxID=716817 RepID=UPI000B97DD2A|nr:GTPase Era [Rubricoccus marinus]